MAAYYHGDIAWLVAVMMEPELAKPKTVTYGLNGFIDRSKDRTSIFGKVDGTRSSRASDKAKGTSHM